jgi:DNA-binding transcriptional LysR family regulator
MRTETTKETLTFQRYLAMNDYTGLAPALLAGVGIGELPPVVQPELVRDGRLVEVMRQLAPPDRQSLRGACRQPSHSASGSPVQGIRSANGADTLSIAADLSRRVRK